MLKYIFALNVNTSYFIAVNYDRNKCNVMHAPIIFAVMPLLWVSCQQITDKIKYICVHKFRNDANDNWKAICLTLRLMAVVFEKLHCVF